MMPLRSLLSGRDLRATLIYAVTLPVLPFVLPSVPLATEIVIMTIAVLSCYLVLSYGPLLSFGQGAFFGIGAYVGGLYAIKTNGTMAGDTILALLSSASCAAIVALAVGAIALRRVAGVSSHGAGGVTFLMLTFAVAQVVFFAAYSMPQVTGGENGLLDVPRIPVASVWSLASPLSFYALCGVVLGMLIVFVDVASSSVIGRAFSAIRENEHRASAVGFNVFGVRLALFSFAGGVAGLAGCLYGFFLGLVPLSSIDITQSERIVIAAVLGGTGSPAGALLGTICFIMGADLLSHVWPHWQFALGAIIVLTVFFARGGLWGVVEHCARFVVPLRLRKAATR